MNLQMELTNYCNLRCVECPNRLMQRKREHMSMKVFEAIKTEYIEKMDFGTIILHKDGEPLLHPNFKEIVRAISRVSSAKLDLYTNGIFLTQDVVDLFGSLLNQCAILVSFHFENADGSRNDYEQKTEEIRKMLLRAGSNIDFVVTTHIVRENDRQRLSEWKKGWDELRKTHPSLKAVYVNEHINPWCGRIDVGDLVSFDACPYGDGEHLFIGSTGNVIPCCMDLEEEVIFGNILNNAREDILEMRKQFYSELARKEYYHSLCRRCLKNDRY